MIINGEMEGEKTDDQQIHVAKSSQPEENPDLSGKAKKLMHRFTEEQVLTKMEEVESLR